MNCLAELVEAVTLVDSLQKAKTGLLINLNQFNKPFSPKEVLAPLLWRRFGVRFEVDDRFVEIFCRVSMK